VTVDAMSQYRSALTRPDARREISMNKTSFFGSRAFWLRQMRQWHWISAAVCLIGMLLFAITGITLNHAAQIEAKPSVSAMTKQVPSGLLVSLRKAAADRTALPKPLLDWIATEMSVNAADRAIEWSPQEAYISLPRPGGDAWLSIALDSGEAQYERTDRGWLAYLNDLHKGRNTGAVWSWFLDIFAVACVVFCLTGLVLLQLMASGRKMTWPLVGLGLVVPLLLAVFFMH
jgi:hypothetical protein